MEEKELSPVEKRLLQMKRMVSDMIATSKDSYKKTNSKFTNKRSKVYSREEIDRIITRGDILQKAALSEYFFTTNGLYKRIILHYATFLTYSWIVVPYLKKQNYSLTEKKNSETYYKATDFLTTFQVERKCAIFAKEVLVKGAYYGLLQDDGENVVIRDLPFDYCRSRFKNSKDIDIIEFSMKFFDTEIVDEDLRREALKTYPKIIQKGYYSWKHKNGPEWIFLPAEMGIYFSYFEERPLFMDLIPLLDDLDDYKVLDKERNKQALKRILVQKIALDGSKLVFEPTEAEEMHEGVVEMLTNNPDIDVITTYNDVNLLDLSSDDDEKTEIKDMQDLIYESAGMSKEFFFPTTEAGLSYSANNDLAMMMVLGQKFAHFFTTLLNYKFENKKLKFELIMLPLSYYNSADYTSRAKELACFGYSFLTPILSTGLNQVSLANLKMLENDLLNLDEILKPLQSSYTQSGKKSGEPIGDTPGKSDPNKSDSNDDKEKEDASQKDSDEKEGED